MQLSKVFSCRQAYDSIEREGKLEKEKAVVNAEYSPLSLGDGSILIDDFQIVTDYLCASGIKTKIWRSVENQYELEFVSKDFPQVEKTSLCIPIGEYASFREVKEDANLWKRVSNLSMKIQDALTIRLLTK